MGRSNGDMGNAVERMHVFLSAHLRHERQPQEETDDGNGQDQQLSGTRLPQLAWEQVSDGCGQALHAHELFHAEGKR